MAKRQISGSRVIITGASSGIGWHLAQQMADEGAKICATARRSDRLKKLQTEIRSRGHDCEIVVGDITVKETQTELLRVAEQTFGGLDILINNAGIGAMGRFDEADPDRLRKIFEVNFFAAADLIRSALPLLEKGNDSLIVNISSVLGHRAAPLKTEYCASKFAIHGFSDALRAELVSKQIGVLLVSPSTTDSEFFDQAIEDDTKKDWKSGGAMPPESVAAKTIKAILAHRQEIILTHGGRALVWLDRLCPPLANWLVAKYGM